MEVKIRTCTRCGQEYQPTGSNQKYCAECGPIVNRICSSKRHKENPEENRTGAAKWDKENPERHSARATKWDRENPDKRKASSRASCAKWYRLHPECDAVHFSKRRALKYGNTPPDEMLTSTEWLAILSDANGHCAYCDKEAKLTLDHVIPLIRGGKHSKDNVVPACGHCNDSKGRQTLEEWMAKQQQEVVSA